MQQDPAADPSEQQVPQAQQDHKVPLALDLLEQQDHKVPPDPAEAQ